MNVDVQAHSEHKKRYYYCCLACCVLNACDLVGNTYQFSDSVIVTVIVGADERAAWMFCHKPCLDLHGMLIARVRGRCAFIETYASLHARRVLICRTSLSPKRYCSTSQPDKPSGFPTHKLRILQYQEAPVAGILGRCKSKMGKKLLFTQIENQREVKLQAPS